MKKISGCLLLSGFLSAPVVIAKTNVPAVIQTNLPATVAQTNAADVSAPIVYPPVNLPDAMRTNPPVQRAMSLEDCIAQALRYNFDVRVERYEPLKAELGLDEAYAGYDPAFNIAGQHNFNEAGGSFQNGILIPPDVSDQNAFNSSLGGVLPTGFQYTLSGNVAETYGTSGGTPFDSTSGSAGLTMAQPLLKNLWIDSTRLAIVAAKNNVKQSIQGVRQQLITTVTAVENAYFELIYAQENVTVQQQALELAQTQLDEDKQRVQIGTVAERSGTIEQDEAQVAQSKASLILAESTLGTDQRVLKNLISDDYSRSFAADIEPTSALDAPMQVFDLQDSWNKGMTQRPDLLQARLTLEQQGIQLKYDWNQLFPELDLIGSYGFNGAGKEFSDAFGQINEGNRAFYSYGGQLTMPLSNLKARSTYKADKAVEKQDLLRLKQLEQNILVAIDNAVGVARSDYEAVVATKQARIYAEAALDAEQKKYAVGKSTTFTVLQLQNTLTSDRAAEIRAVANYQEALTALAQQEGSTLERRHVDVDVK